MTNQVVVRWQSMICCVLIAISSHASAATPQQIARGQQLFTQEFTSTPLNENGDGLGPVFNHSSCVACHHAGGVGGAGDHRFNARTFSVSGLEFDQQKAGRPLVETLKDVAPGFVSLSGQVINTAAMHRRGGSPEFDRLRQQTMARFNPHWTDDASITSDAIHSEATAQTFIDVTGGLVMTGHIHGRNTTALFGAGLIDLVPESVIMQQATAQQRHPEIDGRPATLADGRIGRFGWRANFATLREFTENACVNELGLQTGEVPQPKDMMQPTYANTRIDIDNDSVEAMNAFIASLPSPTRLPAFDSEHREQIARGEARFSAIGCAICHVPSLGPVAGLYSDLLLHDMGPSLRDYNAAPPYRKNIEIGYELSVARAVKGGPVAYYGGPSVILGFESVGLAQRQSPGREFRFEAPQRPPRTVTEPVKFGHDDIIIKNELAQHIGQAGSAFQVPTLNLVYQRVSRSDVIPTNFTQEWRTAPLWGMSDSAPYMHDGRAATVLEATAMHDGESRKTRDRFFALPYEDQQEVLAFLDTLVAPQAGVLPEPKDFTRRHLAKY